jgi:hypothetical protein
MRRILGITTVAAALFLAPAAAMSTTVTTIAPNQISVGYTSAGADLVLGPLDLATNPIAITALFGGSNIDGSLAFDVFSSTGAPGARGSVNINIVADNETFIGTFDGTPLNFVQVAGDYVASFQTAFSGPGDLASFFLDFSGFDPGDQFQVNVSAVPLPWTLPLLLAGLGGLGLVARRKEA